MVLLSGREPQHSLLVGGLRDPASRREHFSGVLYTLVMWPHGGGYLSLKLILQGIRLLEVLLLMGRLDKHAPWTTSQLDNFKRPSVRAAFLPQLCHPNCLGIGVSHHKEGKIVERPSWSALHFLLHAMMETVHPHICVLWLEELHGDVFSQNGVGVNQGHKCREKPPVFNLSSTIVYPVDNGLEFLLLLPCCCIR